MKVSNIVDTSPINSKYADLTSSSFVKGQSIAENSSKQKSDEQMKEIVQLTVNKLNQFAEIQNRNSKFVFHDGLKEYYVEVVNAQTDEVIKEIPPKKILDTYYELQKIFGKIFDEKV
ncbi:flagellar protein FlaG [Rummeliibacillus pycnus]|uniref:flagellar protein FlaG n=1 Tax=Rummeliibacillus pycnus TaxID=101070 RepID=UPI001FE48530|nr:flagellar protein FlaG [Rummeliibacillus pycnus]